MEKQAKALSAAAMATAQLADFFATVVKEGGGLGARGLSLADGPPSALTAKSFMRTRGRQSSAR